MINYYKVLYDVTAELLMLSGQMKEYPYTTVISRYICESHCMHKERKFVGYENGFDIKVGYAEAIGILLSLERYMASGDLSPLLKSDYELLKSLADSVSDEYICENYSGDDITAIKNDIKTAREVLKFYIENELVN
ncbi:MAG: hypothetical protein IJ583_15710 [Firmicutes bacterium]|nr:hypothetical protein [Bacillota bacterium]